METIYWIISTAGAVIALIITVAKALNLKGLKDVAERALTYHELAEKFMPSAEDFKDLTGHQKRAWVLRSIEQEMSRRGMKFDMALAIRVIEKIIEVTKKVNARP